MHKGFFCVFLFVVLAVLCTPSSKASYVADGSLALPSSMPVVFLDLQNASGDPGETFMITVKIFNLSDNYYVTNTRWLPGDELGAPGGILLNYSLGNLYGFDVQLSWNPDVLQYVSHAVKVPVDTYDDGILYYPKTNVRNDVDEVAGTYWLVETSLDPALLFNRPDANSTVFTMNFRVLKKGVHGLRLDSVDLATTWYQSDQHNMMIPHVVAVVGKGREYSFSVVWDDRLYRVTVWSMSSVSEFNFDYSQKRISFDVQGLTQSDRFCEVIIPNELISGFFSLYFNGISLTEGVDYTHGFDGTHNIFIIDYVHSMHGIDTIEIEGTEVIPERQTLLTLPLIIITALAAALAYRRSQKTRLRN